MKKVMMIGKIGCGKTTLSQRLLGETVRYKKTQAVEVVGSDILDTPGEYLEQKQFYSALIVTATEADIIFLLLAANEEQAVFSPRMNSMFGGKPVIGVITKRDLADDPEQLATDHEILELAGAREIVEIGFGDEAGIDRLKEILEETEA